MITISLLAVIAVAGVIAVMLLAIHKGEEPIEILVIGGIVLVVMLIFIIPGLLSASGVW